MSFPHGITLANISRKACTSYGFLLDFFTQSFSLEIKLSSHVPHCLWQKPKNLSLERPIEAQAGSGYFTRKAKFGQQVLLFSHGLTLG